MKSFSEITGRKVKEWPEGTRAAMDGSVSKKTTYKEWFDRQSNKRQLEILGPGKLELYRENRLSFRDMVHGNGRPLTIPELSEKVDRTGFKPKGPIVVPGSNDIES